MANTSMVFKESLCLKESQENQLAKTREEGEINEKEEASRENPIPISESAHSFNLYLTWLMHFEYV